MYQVKRSFGEKVFDFLNYSFMIFAAFTFLYPVWDTLILSFSNPTTARELGLRLYPKTFNLSSYIEVFNTDVIWIGYMNTIIRVIGAVILTVLVTYCGAYTLSKKNLPFKNVILIFILITMFFSGGLIPTYVLMRNLNLINSRWALILPSLTSAWNLIITRNFISSLPDSLEESAFIDGAHPLIVVFKIMMPLSMPILAVLTLWTAVGHWNAWFDALIYVRAKEKMVLQLVLRRILIDQSEELIKSGTLMQTTAETTPETVKAATIMVSIAPIVCFYPFLQKYFVKGVMVGALKG